MKGSWFGCMLLSFKGLGLGFSSLNQTKGGLRPNNADTKVAFRGLWDLIGLGC